MKKGIFVIMLFISAMAFAQQNPCKFTTETKGDKTIYRGERNYVNTNYDKFRVCIQYLYDGEKHCLGLTMDVEPQVNIAENSTIFVQFSNNEEVELKLTNIEAIKKKIECHYAIPTDLQKLFTQETISAIYFSTEEYPQVEIPELNKYTARKLKERFECGIRTIE